MKKLLILILLFILPNICYSAPVPKKAKKLPTSYDLKQDKNIKGNTEIIKKETDQRVDSDKKLDSKISTETKNRISTDQTLQTNINQNTSTIQAVDITQTKWNKKQDKQLKNHDTRITNNTNSINDLDNRVSDLEKTQYIIEGEVRVIDTRKWTVKPFIRYSETRSKFDTVGVRFTWKLRRSFEEKKIEELETKLRKAGIIE